MISPSRKALAAVIALSALPSISAAGYGLAIGAKMGNGSAGKSGDKRAVKLSNLPKSCCASNEISVTLPNAKSRPSRKILDPRPIFIIYFHGESNEDGSSFEYILSGPNIHGMFGVSLMSLIQLYPSSVLML